MFLKRKIILISSLTITFLFVFLCLIYFQPTKLTPPTRLAGLYNNLAGRRGFGIFKVAVNGQRISEKQTVVLYPENEIDVGIDIANGAIFRDVDVSLYINDHLVATQYYPEKEYSRHPKRYIISGSPVYTGMVLKVVVTGYLKKDTSMSKFKKGMKFRAYQTNVISYKETADF